MERLGGGGGGIVSRHGSGGRMLPRGSGSWGAPSSISSVVSASLQSRRGRQSTQKEIHALGYFSLGGMCLFTGDSEGVEKKGTT